MDELKPINFNNVNTNLFKPGNSEIKKTWNDPDREYRARRYETPDGHTKVFIITFIAICYVVGFMLGDVIFAPFIVAAVGFIPIVIVSGLVSYLWTKFFTITGQNSGTADDIIGGVIGGITVYSLGKRKNKKESNANMKKEI